ncbi:MAG TPA: dihydrofolate reductase family protein [Pseudonocardia sp.]|jgi:riboflavin-specific deaminase-like protein|nr:dihydrofolate reductase family protein [Pseudonocardia sp.]
MTRPYVLLSAAVSLDGYLDDAGPERLILSGDADFDEVDQLRAECDAILVGAGTVRADDPRLRVRAPHRSSARVAAGRPEHPLRVVVSGSGDLMPERRIWPALVYTTDPRADPLRDRLGARAEVVSLGAHIELDGLLADLGRRGVGRLLVEGGGQIHTQFLGASSFDELRLAVAPIIVGDVEAPRFLRPGRYPGERLRLVATRAVGDVAVLTYKSPK